MSNMSTGKMMKYPSISLPPIKVLFDKMIDNDESIASFDDMTNFIFGASRIVWVGDITQETGDNTEATIRFWNYIDDYDRIPVGDRKPILLNITSNGGDLDAALMIVDAIQLSKTPVITLNIGCAYSGGAFIAATGHKRYCYPRSTYLLHEGSVEGAGGDAHKFRNFNDFYKKRVEQIKELILDCTNIDEETYEKYRKDDWWFTAQEALEAGLVDEIVTSFPNLDCDFVVNRKGYHLVN